MKDFFKNAFSIICVCVAGTCLIYGRDGWGWFLVAAILTVKF